MDLIDRNPINYEYPYPSLADLRQHFTTKANEASPPRPRTSDRRNGHSVDQHRRDGISDDCCCKDMRGVALNIAPCSDPLRDKAGVSEIDDGLVRTTDTRDFSGLFALPQRILIHRSRIQDE